MMKKRCSIFRIIFISLVLLSGTSGLRAQVFVSDSLAALGDRLREEYRFDESAAAYAEALERAEARRDSSALTLLKGRLLLAENGRNMTGFVYRPTVVARHMFSLTDFFLYYPLKDKSWRQTPNVLDSKSGAYAKALYAPAEDRIIYYSATDQDGIRNIYRTTSADTIWTLPSLLNEHITSDADEIYPVVSPDGSSLYFASNGLHGVGGYDIYVSKWDKAAGDWAPPVNMGFPYSSPANDFLLVNSEDGKYTFFASDRGCPKDSVMVYVLEYDSMPVRSSISDPQELMRLSRLEPSVTGTGSHAVVKSEIPENMDARRYMDKMAQVRALRDTISLQEDILAEYREAYSLTEDMTQKKRLEAEILNTESMMPYYRERLDKAVRQLQEVEMEFLFSGVVIDPDKLLAEAEREIISETPDFAFSRMDFGEPLTLEMETPVPKFDYSFKILDQGQFAEDNTIPSGIIYQIQIFSTSSPASVKSLKGLSPVFRSRSATGKHVYRVGLFNTYSDVLSNLNKVKKLGFKGAYIIGYSDGKEMPVGKVRALEAERKIEIPVLYHVKMVPSSGELDDVAMEGIRQQSGGKDIARADGVLIIGPYDSRDEALALVEFINVMGYGKAEMETIKTN